MYREMVMGVSFQVATICPVVVERAFDRLATLTLSKDGTNILQIWQQPHRVRLFKL